MVNDTGVFKKWWTYLAVVALIFGLISLVIPIWSHEVSSSGYTGSFHLTWFGSYTSGMLGEVWLMMGLPVPCAFFLGLFILVGIFSLITSIFLSMKIDRYRGVALKLTFIGSALLILAPILFWVIFGSMDLNTFYVSLYGIPWDASTGKIVFFGTETLVSAPYTFNFTWYASMAQVIVIIGGVMGIGYGVFLRTYEPDYEQLEKMKREKARPRYQRSSRYQRSPTYYRPQGAGQYQPRPVYRPPLDNRPPEKTYTPQKMTQYEPQKEIIRPSLPRSEPPKTGARGPVPNQPTGNSALDKLRAMFDRGEISYDQYWTMRDLLE